MLQAAQLRSEAVRRKAAKQALAERAALLESITDAFYALDRQLRFTYINHRALDYFKREREGLLGRRIDEVFPAVKGTLLEAQLQRVLREQCSVAFETFSSVAQSWIDLNIYPAAQGLTVYFRDISDRKRAEQELQRAEESLRQSDRRKSEFLALLAHELRNPLAPIANGVKILRLRAAADATADRTLDMMDRQLKHLVRLVDDLLDVGRITSGKLQLRMQRVVMAEVLETAVESTRNQIEALGHELVVDIRAHDLVVEADPDRLVQVFANLLTNGAKYTERGGRIQITLERQGQEAVVMVADNGIGIPEKSIGEVFEMFSQLGNRPSHAEGGLGIGLALVHRLVQMHGGAVTAGSAGVGKGSTFTIRLPAQAVAPASRPQPQLATAPP
jgi:PAS domain S-box-containing protein